MAPVKFADLTSADGLKELDAFLLHRSYISGFQASRDDLAVYSALDGAPSADTPHAARWYNHISALLGPSFSGSGVGVVIGSGATASAAGAPAAPAAVEAPKAVAPPTPAAAAAKDEDDDDDLDLFGEQTEEEKKAQADREAANAKPAKKKESGKSSVLLDVKPWDDETDMKELEAAVRAVEMEGLTFGASKLVEVGYGIKKLVIMLTIIDDLVSLDELIEDYLTKEGTKCGDHIQSCDIVAFNKI